ncbi:MAG TPA: hypothetical protein VJ794_08990 [Gemmatimonadales bacterium]|nr:hypothetical protein [Gemmatimonadales bacterium]
MRTVTLGGLAERIAMSEDGTAIITNSTGLGGLRAVILLDLSP